MPGLPRPVRPARWSAEAVERAEAQAEAEENETKQTALRETRTANGTEIWKGGREAEAVEIEVEQRRVR